MDLFSRLREGLPKIAFTLQCNFGKGLNFLSFFINPCTTERKPVLLAYQLNWVIVVCLSVKAYQTNRSLKSLLLQNQ